MPVHEYEHCHIRLEQFEGVSGYENTWPLCPRCGERMDRLISAPAFRVIGHNAANSYNKTSTTSDPTPRRN